MARRTVPPSRLFDGQKYYEIQAATAADCNWVAMESALKELGLD